MKWKDEYAIGIEMIDEQHKKLFAIAQEAEDLLDLPSKMDKFDEAMKLVQDLKDYVDFHFAAEEEVLKEIEYDKFFKHCIYHHDFVIKIRSMRLDDLDNHQEEHIRALLNLLNTWLLSHVTREDILWAKDYKEKKGLI